MGLTAVYSCLVGGDGEDVVERNSAQCKDGKQQGDNRAGEIPPAHKKKKLIVRLVKIYNSAPMNFRLKCWT